MCWNRKSQHLGIKKKQRDAFLIKKGRFTYSSDNRESKGQLTDLWAEKRGERNPPFTLWRLPPVKKEARLQGG